MHRAARLVVVQGLLVMGLASIAGADLPAVFPPSNNPITPQKSVLGKILFWDEQLSSSGTMACGTCHLPAHGGSDNRRQRAPGLDVIFNTPDDTFGSPGVIRSDSNRNFKPDPKFGFGVQVTGRNSMTFLMAAFAPQNFWDGRSFGPFSDPVTGQLVNSGGAALENQALGPVVSDVEMSHEGRTWSDVLAKLGRVKPLALASAIPADVRAVVTPGTTYADLFQAAFGTPQISATRVAQAIATYERTLVPDQTPWDRFVAGETGALTPAQQAGLNTFNGAGKCVLCHGGNTFTGSGFRNIGLRPLAEDVGRQAVSGSATNAGQFKAPSLRNAGLRNQFMHNGGFTSLAGVVAFYGQFPGAPPRLPDNIDFRMAQIALTPQMAPDLVDFVANGLTDPRVAAETYPFDRPVLFSQREADRPVALAGGVPGSGGVTPRVIVGDPPMLGNVDFRVGVMSALGGANAQVIMTSTPPVDGRLIDGNVIPVGVLSGSGSAGGYGTLHWPVPAYGQLAGVTFYFQWQITDVGAAGGVALSEIARVTFFCPSQGCPPACLADFNLDSDISPDDLGDYITAYFSPVPPGSVDINGDGDINPDDLGDFITAYFAGCGNG